MFIPDLNLAMIYPPVIFFFFCQRKYGTPGRQSSNNVPCDMRVTNLEGTSRRHKSYLALCIKIHKHVHVSLAQKSLLWEFILRKQLRKTEEAGMLGYAHCGVFSFNKPLLSAYYVPGTRLAQSLCFKAFTISWEFREVYTEL